MGWDNSIVGQTKLLRKNWKKEGWPPPPPPTLYMTAECRLRNSLVNSLGFFFQADEAFYLQCFSWICDCYNFDKHWYVYNSNFCPILAQNSPPKQKFYTHHCYMYQIFMKFVFIIFFNIKLINKIPVVKVIHWQVNMSWIRKIVGTYPKEQLIRNNDKGAQTKT